MFVFVNYEVIKNIIWKNYIIGLFVVIKRNIIILVMKEFVYVYVFVCFGYLNKILDMLEFLRFF